MKRFLFCLALLLAGCHSPGVDTQNPNYHHATPPAVRSTAIRITFPNPPSPAAVLALQRAKAVKLIESVWTMPSYDFHNQDQGDAVHAALVEGAHIGPPRE